jgi:hypothetical protein
MAVKPDPLRPNVSESFLAPTPRDPDPLLSDLKDMVKHHANSHPRHAQVALGPSQVGHPCARNIIQGMLEGQHGEHGVNPQFDVLPSYIGVATHKALEDAATLDNITLGRERWLTERKVKVTEGLSGTCDLYDTDSATVIDYKGLALDTAIPTPLGWTTMGQLRRGDYVFDAAGCPTVVKKVTGIHQCDCYRIIFEDGTTVICDDEHEWVIQFGQDSITRTMTAPQMARKLRCSKGQSQIRIVNNGSLRLPPTDLDIEPYLLGAWLGDGDRTSGRIALADPEIFSHIEAAGNALGPGRKIKGNCIRRRIYGLTGRLSSMNLIGDKHIPSIYLRASHEQRLSLLQGLMDTDGTWNTIRNHALFCNSDKALIHQVAELVSTLGWKPTIDTFTAKGFGLVTISYRVGFVPLDSNPFRLQRKADLVRNHAGARSKRRFIKSIERTLTVPTRCVSTVAETFLCTEAMIPTHNCPGTTKMGEYRARIAKGLAPSELYRVQAHLYGKGYRNEGYPVERVGIWLLPRSGLLATSVLWLEQYDESLVQHHISRLYDMQLLMQDMDLENHPERLSMIPMVGYGCSYCPWFSVTPDRHKDNPYACPGAPEYQPKITPGSGMTPPLEVTA